MPLEVLSLSISTSNRPNEDACKYWLNKDDQSRLIAAIADGVGGNVGGSIASNIAVELSVQKLIDHQPDNFSEIFSAITKQLADLSNTDNSLVNMATTLTVLSVKDNLVKFGHVGDTRLYHLRSNGLLQKTKDQTEIALLVEQGVITPKRAKNYPRRSVLVSALSRTDDYTLQEAEFEVQSKDRLILLSDGAYKVLPKNKIRDLSLQSATLIEFGNKLSYELSQIELNDDASIVLIEII